jgi:hypothetical protein
VESFGSIATSLEQRIFEAPGWRGLAVRVASFVCPWAFFVATLMIPWPEWVLAQAYRGGGRVIFVAALALWVAHARRGWLGVCLGLTVTFALFALPLAAVWQDVTHNGFAIGGLLPWSDAQATTTIVRRLLDGYPMEWSARRPLFPRFSRCCLLSHGSLYIALALMVALNAIATFSLHEKSCQFGSAAAVSAMLALFTYYRTTAVLAGR